MTYEEYLQRVNEKTKKRYSERREKGLCGICGKVEMGERSMCAECSKKHLERQKETWHLRKDSGLCVRCGKAHNGKYTMCFECRLKDAERKMKKKEVTA